MAKQRQIIATAQAPAAVGPYSQAVKFDSLVFTAGQIPLVPETGKLIDGEIEDQTRQALVNLTKILEAANSGLAHVVKTTVFVTDMTDFSKINEVYGSFFGSNPPARSTVQVAALPLGARIEIEAIAIADNSIKV